MTTTPFHVLRAELAALRASSDAPAVLARLMALGAPPVDTDYADDYAHTLASQLARALREGALPPPGSAALLRDFVRRALIADLDDETVRRLTLALLATPDGDFAASWLQELLPRYGARFDGAPALAIAAGELRAQVYNGLAAPALVPALLREDADVIRAAADGLMADGNAVRAASPGLSDAAFEAVTDALRYLDDGLLVDVARAWTATHDNASDAARAMVEFAGEAAVRLWRHDDARALAAWLQARGAETAWVDEIDARPAAVEALRARLADGATLAKGEIATLLECGTMRVVGDEATGYLAEDARGLWHVVSAGVRVTLGRADAGSAFAGAAVRGMRRFGNLVLLGDGEGRWCLAGYNTHALSQSWQGARDDVDTVLRLGDALDPEGLSVESRFEGATETADPTRDGGAWLASQVRRGASLRMEHPSPPERFTDWLRAVDGCAWSTVPPQLARMGLDPSFASVTVTPAEPAAMPPALASPALDALWSHGCATLTVGGRTLRLCTPREVLDAAAVEFKNDDTVIACRPLVVDARGRMVVGLGVDDGRLAGDRERFVHAGRRWITDLETALGLALERVVKDALVALLGRSAYDRARTDERVKVKPRVTVARRASAADAWAFLEKWLKKNGAGVRFKRGASAKKLAALTALAPSLPPFALDLWKTHDGDDESGSLGGWSMMDVDGIVNEHAFWMGFTSAAPPPDDDPSLPAVWWDASWVPFASSGGGDFLAVDTSPAGGGRVFVLLMDPPFRRVLAPSFEDFVIELVHAIERGDLTCDDGEWTGLDEFLSGPGGA